MQPKRVLPFLLMISTLMIVGLLLYDHAFAQDSPAACTVIVDAALEAVDNTCSGTARNQACYGNFFSQAIFRENAPAAQFESVGDIADLLVIDSLQLSELNVIEEQWGVVLMQAQANLPDTLPGQNVTFLLFGDVQMRDLSEADKPTAEVSTLTGVNVRLTPSESGALLGSLGADQAITVTGLHTNSAGQTWAQVRYVPENVMTGWVIAGALTGDLSTLPEVESTSQVFGPMQAFYFQTGIGRPACVEAPVNGIVVQTPQGAGKVSFTSNGVEVLMGSTAFIQAQPGETMDFYLLEGEAILTANRGTQRLTPGMMSQIPLGEDGMANGVPGFPQAYDLNIMETLRRPILFLPRPIVTIPRPATPELPPTATPTPTVVPVTPQPGDDPGTTPGAPVPCPLSRDVGATVYFTNVEPTGKTYKLYRLNQQCGEVSEGDLAPFGRRVIGTYAGFTWIVKDQNGREITRFTVPGGGDHFIDVVG